MRVLVVAALVALAGCAGPAAPVGPDPTSALHSGENAEALYQYGPQTNGTPDGHVLVGRCATHQNVMAYTFNATRMGFDGATVPLTASQVPNATAFFVAAFVPGAQGLEPADAWRGGNDASIQPYHQFYVAPLWSPDLPERFDAPVGGDGLVRIVLACKGDGAVNYVLGTGTGISSPNYLQPTVGRGFEVFLALASETASTIYIPPSGPPPLGVMWSIAGRIGHSTTQDIPHGVRVGQTAIEWSAGPGWSSAVCEHDGSADHGSWTYKGDMHGHERDAGGLLVDDLFSPGLLQLLFFGAPAVAHAGDGNEEASFRFIVDHQLSANIAWFTTCHGAHLEDPLSQLFGQAGAPAWEGIDPNIPVPP